MQEIAEFNKDQLAAYAKTEFKVNLDMRKSLSKLVEQVSRLRVPVTDDAAPATHAPAYLLNISTGLFFVWTPMIAEHLGDLGVPCDSNRERI
jgi:hypothetical protein